jgi:predicted nucleotide-binding protein (sugar kinase/HSP70/actin superfamily)
MTPAAALTPVVHMRHDPDTLSIELYEQLKKSLQRSKMEFQRATRHAAEMQRLFSEELLAVGRETLQRLPEGEPFVVVTGRPYNLYDKRMNLSLGKNLSRMGLAAVPMDYLDLDSEDLSEFPSMYWGLGARILRAVKFIKNYPNAFGLHLTNFGCGADSFIEHFYRYLMGEKAYLILELDEHSGAAGVMTRLEAYRNVIENSIHSTEIQGEETENAIHLLG